MTVDEMLTAATRDLAASGIESPRREARLLMAAATGLSTATLTGWPERLIEDAAQRAFRRFLARRVAGEPFSRIVGTREFWSLDFELGPDTLDPRPDTETIVSSALDWVKGVSETPPPRILDLGTGTGCILLALLSEMPRAIGFGIDRSAGAIRIARHNAERLCLADRAYFAVMDWASGIEMAADLIVSNPPYIPTEDIARLDIGVRDFDPRLALDGGADGLAAYRVLLAEIPRLLSPGGAAVLELGAGQADDIAAIAIRSGLAVTRIERDLAGHPRAMTCTLGEGRRSLQK